MMAKRLRDGMCRYAAAPGQANDPPPRLPRGTVMGKGWALGTAAYRCVVQCDIATNGNAE